MRRAMTICALFLSVAALGAAGDIAATSATALTNGEFASMILKTSQPQAAQLKPETALQEVQDLGLMPADWRSDAVVTQQAFADVMAGFGVHYAVTSNAAPVSDTVAETYLQRENERVHETVFRPTDRLLSQQNLLNEGRRPILSESRLD